MENFQYSVQLSERDWAEFAAAADECGLLQASLASGDELPCSDIEQGDSSGSSPPEGRAWPNSRQEDEQVTGPLVSRCRPENGQQTPGTSVLPWTDPTSPEPAPAAAASMQRLLQGPAPRPPEPPKGPPNTPEEPSTALQQPPSSPRAPLRSPGRKKRRSAARGDGRPGASVSPQSPAAPAQAQAEQELLPTKGVGQGEWGPGMTRGSKKATRPPPSTPEGQPDTDLLRTNSQALRAHRIRAEPTLSTSNSQPQQLVTALSTSGLDSQQLDTALSTPTLDPQQLDTALSTPTLDAQQLDTALSTSTLDPQQLDTALSTPALDAQQLDTALSTPALDPQQLDTALCTPTLDTQQLDTTLSTPALDPQQLDTALSTPALNAQQLDTALSTPVLGAQQLDTTLSTPALDPQQLDTAPFTLVSDPQQLDTALSPPTSKPLPDTALSTFCPKLQLLKTLSTPTSDPQQLDSSTPTSDPQQQLDTAMSTPTSNLQQLNMAVSIQASKLLPDTAMLTVSPNLQLHTTLSEPSSSPQQSDSALTSSSSKSQVNTTLSTSSFKLQPDHLPLSTPCSKPQVEMALSTPTCKLQPDTALSRPSSKPPPDTSLSTPLSELNQDSGQPAPNPVLKPETGHPSPASKASSPTALPPLAAQAPSSGVASTPILGTQAGSDVGGNLSVDRGGCREKSSEELSVDGVGLHAGDTRPADRATRRKKVRFSIADPGPKQQGAMSSGPPSPNRPSVLRTAAGGAGAPGTWDAVAVGSRSPQPRILKHLPPPAPSALGGLVPQSCFAVTVPEAYEFFFCDTIEEEEEEDAEDSQATTEMQWPDMCEFFFRDTRAQRQRRPPSPAPEPPSPPAPAPTEPTPFAFPEAYEHFLGEDGPGSVLNPAALLQLRALEAPNSYPQRMGSGPLPDVLPATSRHMELALRTAGQPQVPRMSFKLSQRDMCLVFVAFATWAVRTSDLQTPDAWKTVLLANIGTVSAIRYFRRQVGRGRHGPSQSPSPSRSPSPSP